MPPIGRPESETPDVDPPLGPLPVTVQTAELLCPTIGGTVAWTGSWDGMATALHCGGTKRIDYDEEVWLISSRHEETEVQHDGL